MKCILMNKNTEVFVVEYNSVLKGFSDIYEITNIDYAPVIINNLYKKTKDNNVILEQLDSVVEEFDTLLHRYASITKISDRRINKICTLLYTRINQLKKIVNE